MNFSSHSAFCSQSLKWFANVFRGGEKEVQSSEYKLSNLTQPLRIALWLEINLLARALRSKYPHLTASITVAINRLPCRPCQKEKQRKTFQVTLCEKTVSKAQKQLAKANQTGHRRTQDWEDLPIKNAHPTMA